METPLSGSHLGPHRKRITRSVQQGRLQSSSLFLVHALLRRLPLLQPQFTAETFDHEYKYSLPSKGSPFNGLGIRLLVHKVLAHKDTQRMVWIRSERSAPFVPLLVVESQCFLLVWPCFQEQLRAPSPQRRSLEFNQHAASNALATVLWAHVHSFQFTNGAGGDDCTATDSFAIAISRDHEHDVRLLERHQIQSVSCLGRIERVLVRIQFCDQADDFRLVWRFLQYTHGGVF